jgi:spore germination cell wall hydrolase CwlJ-like protein
MFMKIIFLISVLIFSAGAKHRHKTYCQQTPPNDYQSIVRLTVATLYLEAASEPDKGKLGVAAVIWNRAGDEANIAKVILARKQFSCWNRRNWKTYKPPNNKDYRYCLVVAKDLVDGTFVPPKIYRGVIAYHEQSVRPDWRSDFRLVVQVGKHLFYSDKQ